MLAYFAWGAYLRRAAVLCCVFGLVLTQWAGLGGARLQAGDWPQILGPNRNGEASGEQLAAWSGPELAPQWAVRVGSGYAGVAVAQGKVVVFHREGDQELIDALAAESGKRIWRVGFSATYRGGIDPDIGPRCVPLIDGDRVIAFGAGGDLHCVELATGKNLWSQPLYAQFGAEEGYFGAGSTPIVLGGKVLVNVGAEGAGIVAVDRNTGKIAWKASAEQASYSSPTAVRVGEKTLALFVTRLNAVLVDPDTGAVTRVAPFGKRGPTVNAATPLVADGQAFFTASYGVGALLVGGLRESAPSLWSSDNVLSSQYSTPVLHQGHLYGVHGREDGAPGDLRCVDWKTGTVKWSVPRFGIAQPILAGDKILLQKVDGTVSLIAADPAAHRELASARLTSDKLRALPALSGGKLFVRTNDGSGGKVLCATVGK